MVIEIFFQDDNGELQAKELEWNPKENSEKARLLNQYYKQYLGYESIKGYKNKFF